jgi:hypothetical protein
MNHLLPTLLLLPFLATEVRADDPLAAAELVRRLGDDSYQVREEASKELLRLGAAAREALQEGTKDSDLEIRRRCRELLPSVLEAQRQAQLEAFIADKDGKLKHNLPGWRRFRQVAGEDAAARRLFVAMSRLDTGFLADTEKALDLVDEGRQPPKETDRAGEYCAVLSSHLFQKVFGQGARGAQGVQVEPAEVAPLLLMAGDPRTNMPPQSRQMVVNFLYQPSLRAALTGPDNPPFKKLTLAWMARQTDDEDAAQQMFFAVQTLDLKEGLDLALKVLKDKPLKGRGLGAALTTVGKLGNKEHLEALVPFLQDKTLVGNFALGRERGATELRDVALAMLVHLTGQEHRSYGFVFSKDYGHLKFYPNFLGFRDDGERTKAFARWKEWKATAR